MERQNSLLPFWYDLSRPQQDNPLDQTPRDRETRDENAGGTMFHTRTGDGSAMLARKRVHDQDDGDSKRRTFEFGHSPSLGINSSNNNSDQLTSETDHEQFESNYPRHHKHYSSNHIHKTSSHPSYPSHPSSESVYFFHNSQQQNKVPSSPPPIHLSNHQLASSPVNYYDDYNSTNNSATDIFTSQATMVPTLRSDDFDIDQDDDGMESDITEDTIDFNITNLNRVHGYISSDFLQEENNYNNIDEEELNFKARIIVAKAIEDGNPQVRLDHIGLRHLPDDMEDLKNMISVNASGIVKPDIEVYASHNRLRVLPPSFFNVENVIVLSLRNNKMKKLTGKISKFQKLTDLSIASNELKVLPYQILNLPNLTNFLVRPNPLLWELRDQEEGFAVQVNEENPNQEVNTRRYVSRLKWSDSPVQSSSQLRPAITNDRQMVHRVSPVPKLTELSLRVISRYRVSLSETKMWKKNVPTYIQKMIAKAIQKGAFEETCSVCNLVTVNPVAKSLEWWDIKTQKLVPLVRKFCSGNCVKQWLDEIDDAVDKFQNGSGDQEGDEADDSTGDRGASNHEIGDAHDGDINFNEEF